MDPLSALSVACAVAQFAEFGVKIFSKSNEIFRSTNGTTDSDSEVEAITSDMENLTSRILRSQSLQSCSGSLSENEVALMKMCQGCQDISEALLKRLKTFKVQKNARRWECVSKAFLSLWSKTEIQEMKERLESYRRQLDTHILVDLRESYAKSDLTNSESFKRLDQTILDGIDSILRGQNDITNNQELQTSILTGIIQQEGLKIRSTTLETIQGTTYDRSAFQPILYSIADGIEKYLATLEYPAMEDRFEQIHDNHDKTFEWIFREPKTSMQPWSNFSKWLQDSDQSIYWISGKAGSGKSTMMAFIRHHPNLTALLNHWCKDAVLVKGSFFYWNSGSRPQRTQNGMFRSLLHEILSRYPNLIPIIEPDYYKQERRHWNDRALRNIFQKLSTQNTLPIKLFLLIDGLDEYEGDHLEIVTFFKQLSKQSNLKICVSSRPLPIFDLAFEDSPSLQLQYLTLDDIQTYVHDKLLNNPILARMHREDEKDVQVLIQSIARRAQGVFLWVVLACTSIINGLVAGDQLSDLQNRVEACPEKLEELCIHMLQRIDPQHKEHSSRLFQIIDAAMGKSYSVPATTMFSARELRFADQSTSSILAAEIKPLSRHKLPQELKAIELCLKTRCAGLVELVLPVTRPDRDRYDRAQDELVYVEYIHRSVREFLSHTHTKSFGDVEHGSVGFDPYLALIGGALMEIKSLDPTREKKVRAHYSTYSSQKSGVLGIVAKALSYASMTSPDSLSSMVILVDEIDRIMNIHWDAWLKRIFINLKQGPSYRDYFDPSYIIPFFNQKNMEHISNPNSSMVKLAAQFGVLAYVKTKIDNDNFGATIFKTGRPILDYAARPAFQSIPTAQLNILDPSNRFLSTIAFLLGMGCDPNETWHGRSPWETLLLMAGQHITWMKETKISIDTQRSYLKMWLHFFKLFIDEGASGTAKFQKRTSSGVVEVNASIMIVDFSRKGKFLSFHNLMRENGEGRVCLTEINAQIRELLEALAKNDGKTKSLLKNSSLKPKRSKDFVYFLKRK